MNRFDIINRIGDKYRIGNTETGEFSYAQALKAVGKDIKDYQKATTGAQHKFLNFVLKMRDWRFLLNAKTSSVGGIKPKSKVSYRTMFALKRHTRTKRSLLSLQKPMAMKYGFGTVNLSLLMTNIAWKKKLFFAHLKNTKTCVLVE